MKLFYALLLPALYFLGIFLHGWLSDWTPGPEPQPIALTQSSAHTLVGDSVLRFVTWNVGYGGLGAESDFSYDDAGGIWWSGSSMVRSPRPLVEKNLRGAADFLQHTLADFYLLQEVDVASDRSYRINQYADYQRVLPEWAASFAVNFQCQRVPIPLLEPWNALGKALSGLGTLSRHQPSEATRHQLPGHYPMPDRMFQLDRCAALHRYPTRWGHDLVVINVHNSAYDPGDKIKAIQLPYLRDLALAEYAKGNFVVIGGDWNQCPPYFRFDAFMPGNTQGYTQGNIPPDFFPENWRYGYDPTVSTNRKARDPYVKGQTFETLIDYFVVSPNLRIREVKGIQQGYQFSDHQPVWMEVQVE
ncbi:MAG TPA: endonuclease/exonuclease/phosphatase family protein [Saprospiraceae bacterium]|nr:endonuclease/exonuclease/phosphatase family protein [Saprospiraceae bacterium]HND88794.1 endonuclease/exonuclease/phosphatase family protein [Saprospiraceae bacterium]